MVNGVEAFYDPKEKLFITITEFCFCKYSFVHQLFCCYFIDGDLSSLLALDKACINIKIGAKSGALAT